MHEYNRSTHDLSMATRTTMSAGTLVPCFKKLALPGDTWDLNLEAEILTHPTIGPLFGTYKVQIDVFEVPIRLYQGKLHMNMLNIGMDMSKVLLPRIPVEAPNVNPSRPLDNQQINPSCILSYLGIRGIGNNNFNNVATQRNKRFFNAVPLLAYWDIYKQYYANKMENVGAVIHTDVFNLIATITAANYVVAGTGATALPKVEADADVTIQMNYGNSITITGTNINETTDPASFRMRCKVAGGSIVTLPLYNTGGNYSVTVKGGVGGTTTFNTGGLFNQANYYNGTWTFSQLNTNFGLLSIVVELVYVDIQTNYANSNFNVRPVVKTFPLTNIDSMRMKILKQVDAVTAVNVANDFSSVSPTEIPYNYLYDYSYNATYGFKDAKMYSQEGLALKTYNSDLFNNWLDT